MNSDVYKDRYAYPQLESDVLYEDSDFEIDRADLNYLTLQSEILEITFATFWREATNPKVLRTFDSGRSPSLIVGSLEPATRLDKRGERCTDGIRDVVALAISDSTLATRKTPCTMWVGTIDSVYVLTHGHGSCCE